MEIWNWKLRFEISKSENSQFENSQFENSQFENSEFENWESKIRILRAHN